MATLPKSMEESSSRWIWWPADSPARISARPGNAPASRELAAAFGLSSPVWFGNLDPATCSLRTSQGSLFTTECDELSENWPDSGMWDAGAVYELRNSEPVTSESACSLWPTASASVANDGETPESWECRKQKNIEKHYNGNGMGTPLTIAVAQWPTPQNHDRHISGRTPEQVAEYRARTGMGISNLNDTAEHWATLNAHDGRRPGSDATSTQGANLKRDAELWATPQAFDAADCQRKEPTDKGGCRTLQNDISIWQPSLPAPAISDGPQSSENVPTSRRLWEHEPDLLWKTPRANEQSQGPRQIKKYKQAGFRQRDDSREDHALDITLSTQVEALSNSTEKRRLNPRFVEWLMGLPVGWTEL